MARRKFTKVPILEIRDPDFGCCNPITITVGDEKLRLKWPCQGVTTVNHDDEDIGDAIKAAFDARKRNGTLVAVIMLVDDEVNPGSIRCLGPYTGVLMHENENGSDYLVVEFSQDGAIAFTGLNSGRKFRIRHFGDGQVDLLLPEDETEAIRVLGELMVNLEGVAALGDPLEQLVALLGGDGALSKLVPGLDRLTAAVKALSPPGGGQVQVDEDGGKVRLTPMVAKGAAAAETDDTTTTGESATEDGDQDVGPDGD